MQRVVIQHDPQTGRLQVDAPGIHPRDTAVLLTHALLAVLKPPQAQKPVLPPPELVGPLSRVIGG